MSKKLIKQLIQSHISEDGLVETGVRGVQFFQVTEPVRCAPVVYEPAVVAIVSGTKEAVLDGRRHSYGSSEYLCCTMSMPVEAGAPAVSVDSPLLGVYVSLGTQMMTELAIELESATTASSKPSSGPAPQGVALASWDEAFGDALLRLSQLAGNPSDAAVLGEGRLRELYYAVLKGDAGGAARRAFGVGNEVARSIEYLSSRLTEKVAIDDVASQMGMSRAVFYRKFKQATSMSPIQFFKSMRLNRAAMKIAEGMSVNEAADEVGYVSSSQFSREFKRMYGQSPLQWRHSKQLPTGIA